MHFNRTLSNGFEKIPKNKWPKRYQMRVREEGGIEAKSNETKRKETEIPPK